jgi:hypothetical protein
MEAVFSVGADPRLYNENPRPAERDRGIVGGDERGTQYLGV